MICKPGTRIPDTTTNCGPQNSINLTGTWLDRVWINTYRIITHNKGLWPTYIVPAILFFKWLKYTTALQFTGCCICWGDDSATKSMLNIWIQKGQRIFMNANPYTPKLNSFTRLQKWHSENLQTHNSKSSTSSLCTLTKSLWASNSCVFYLVRNIINDYNSMSSPVVAGCDGTESFLTCSVPLEKQIQSLSILMH